MLLTPQFELLATIIRAILVLLGLVDPDDSPFPV